MTSPATIHRERLFARMPPICALVLRGGCSGPLQADHVIDRQWIRIEQSRLRLRQWRTVLSPPELRFVETRPDTLIADDRNGLILCERHHQLKTVAMLTLYREEVPEEVREFAADYGIEHALDRFPPRENLR